MESMASNLQSENLPSELEDWLPELRQFARCLAGDPEIAEEIVQESMVRALQRDPNLPEVKNIQGWLFQIAANVFKELWRKRRRQQSNEYQYAANHLGAGQQMPSVVVAHREYLGRIWRFVGELPNLQRQVLLLNLVDGLSNDQIARKLETTTANVKSSLNVARSKLRKRFWDERPEVDE
jgi:RNA polymerase sigma-70 factor (ECF subfamily)